MDSQNQKKAGPIIAILIIVLILIIASLYMFASRVTQEPVPMDDSEPTASVEPVTNTSDEVSDIEADLDAATNGLEDQNF